MSWQMQWFWKRADEVEVVCTVNSELYAVFFACVAGWMVG